MVSFHVHGNLDQGTTERFFNRQHGFQRGGVGKTTTRSCDDVSQVGPFTAKMCKPCMGWQGPPAFMGIHGCEKWGIWESKGMKSSEE